MAIIEICGFIATVLVFVSFLPSEIKLIRWLNLLGSVFFVIYGFSVGALWNGLTNLGLLFVQGYHLIKLYRKKGKSNESGR